MRARRPARWHRRRAAQRRAIDAAMAAALVQAEHDCMVRLLSGQGALQICRRLPRLSDVGPVLMTRVVMEPQRFQYVAAVAPRLRGQRPADWWDADAVEHLAVELLRAGYVTRSEQHDHGIDCVRYELIAARVRA